LRARLKEPVTLVCKTVKYYYKDKRAEATGPVTVTRKTQVVTGDSGVYTANDEIVSLTGNVHGKDEKNQTFDAPSVKMCVKEGAEWMEAPDVKATFYVKDEEQTAGSGNQ
jgi:lipopolysaccharide assembly outer membrane protein LptD (OstA)